MLIFKISFCLAKNVIGCKGTDFFESRHKVSDFLLFLQFLLCQANLSAFHIAAVRKKLYLCPRFTMILFGDYKVNQKG